MIDLVKYRQDLCDVLREALDHLSERDIGVISRLVGWLLKAHLAEKDLKDIQLFALMFQDILGIETLPEMEELNHE